MEVCEGCGLQSVSFDANAGVIVCEGCGLVRQEIQFRHAEFDEEGTKQGTYVGGRGTASSLGLGRSSWTLAPGTQLSFRSDYKKKYTIARVDHLSSLLRLPRDKIDAVKHILGVITEEKWGAHRWIDMLIGTCIYIVSRQHHLPLSAAEIATTLNCSVKEILRVYHRVLDFMEIQSTPFDPSVHFDKLMSHHPAFMSLERDAIRRLSKQGRCLLQYATEWCLSTGRHPLAIVAAVAVIVGRANNIKVNLEMVSRDLHVHPATSRMRFNEFMDALVGFGQRLPWGKDITLKTVSRHLPFLLQYLEARIRMDSGKVAEKSATLTSTTTTTTEASSGEDVALRHIAKALYAKYGPQIRAVLDSQPLDIVREDIDPVSAHGSAASINERADGMKKRKATNDALPCNSLPCRRKDTNSSRVDYSEEAVIGPSTEEAENSSVAGSRTDEEGKVIPAGGRHHTWKPLPPSFLANGSANARRAARIQAAKKRIASVKKEMVSQVVRERKQKSNDEMPSQSIDSVSSSAPSQSIDSASSSVKMHVPDERALDAEDFLIQYCLIRGADEKILQAGYYMLALSTPPVQPDKEIMSDSELLKYFKTPEEIEFLESLSKDEPLCPWLTEDEQI